MKLFHSDRFCSFNYTEEEKGRVFVCTKFQEELTNIKILLSSVDTVRQLYRGSLDSEWLEKIDNLYEESRNHTQVIHDINGFDFVVRPGGASGYKYRLQNNELGLICFVKTHFQVPERTGSHLKIECSPKLLLTTSPEEVQSYMDGIATLLLSEDFYYAGLSLHLAMDIQGYTPRQDFSSALICRSQRRSTFDGIDRAEIDLASVAATYGAKETMTFGSVNALQLSHYNKSKEVIKSDKRDFMNAAWSGELSGNFTPAQVLYDPADGDVWRLEARFSHHVLNQFDEGFQTLPGQPLKDLRMKSYVDAFSHLKALWLYALEQFQLPYQDTKFYDPCWTLFAQDADFNQHHGDVIYKRVQKEPGIDNARNVALALGNILSIHARHGFTTAKSLDFLRNSGIWADVLGYLRDRKIGMAEFNQSWADRLLERRMLRNAA